MLTNSRHPAADLIRVSVIVPAFNDEDYVLAAIESVRAQTEARLEILVIDDCSSDATGAIVSRLAEQDQRIRLIRMPVNCGPAAARNAGLDIARGEWIALLDADDRYEATRLRSLIALAEQNGADIVSDNLLLCREDAPLPYKKMIPRELLQKPKLLTATEFIQRNVGDRINPHVRYGFMHPIIRRDFLARHNLKYDERNRFGEDFVLYTRCLLRGARWWITPEAMYLYTVSNGSLTETQTSDDLNRIRTLEKTLLSDPRVRQDRALTSALRRHKRVIDRCYHYRAFTDAVKAGQPLRALKLLFKDPASIGDVAAETLTQAPLILAKLFRGGYARQEE